MDLNKNKIIYQSDFEIYQWIEAEITKALESDCKLDSHHCHPIPNQEDCFSCCNTWEQSIKISVDTIGLQETINREFQIAKRQQEIDPNIQHVQSPVGASSGPGEIEDGNDPTRKVIKINFIYNDVDAAAWTIDTAEMLADLNAVFSDDTVNTDIYGDRKQLDCRIQWQGVNTVLTGDQVVEWDSNDNGKIGSSTGPAALHPFPFTQPYSQSIKDAALFYGFKENHFNVYIARHPFPSAYAFFPNVFPYGGGCLFPVYNARKGLGAGYTPEQWRRSTIIHEIGHNLNLPHTFGGGAPGSCDIDDGVSDTPNTIANNDTTRVDHCGDGLSMNENYMDYAYPAYSSLSPLFFSQGQYSRMHAALENGLGPNYYTEGTTTTPDPSVTTTTSDPNKPNNIHPTYSDCPTLTLSNATVIGINSAGKFTGEDVLRYTTMETIELEGLIDVRSLNVDAVGVKEVHTIIDNDFKNNIATCAQIRRKISVNGNYLGEGILKSFNYEANASTINGQVLVGSWAATIEFPRGQCDFSPAFDSYNMPNTLSILDSISESFDVSLSDDQTYSFNHTLDIQLINDQPRTDPWPQEAKDFCTAILRQRYDSAISSFNLIVGNHYGDYNVAARDHHTESYDIWQGSFSFSTRFTLRKENAGEYSVARTHSWSQDQSGMVRVVENGEILSKSSKVESVPTWIDQEVSASYSRCLTIMSSYWSNFSGATAISEFGQSVSEYTLHSSPISVTKKLAFGEASASYSVEYTNDEGMWTSAGEYFLERDLSMNKTQGGVWEVVENGSLRFNDRKNSRFDPVAKINSIQGDEPTIKSRCTAFHTWAHEPNYYHHSSGTTHTFYLKDSNFSFDKHGKTIKYSYTYSDSSEFVPLVNNTVSRSSSKEVDTGSGDRFTSYILPWAEDEVLHKPGITQSNLSSRVITVEYTVKRIEGKNAFEDVYNISTILEDARQKAITEAYKAFVDNAYIVRDVNEIYISNASYSFNSDRQLMVTVTAEYPTISSPTSKGI